MKNLIQRLGKSRLLPLVIFLITGLVFCQVSAASTGVYDGIFHHSEITNFDVDKTADIGELKTDIVRIGATPRAVFVEVVTTNTSRTMPIVADFERGYIVANGGLKIQGNGFATQARTKRDRDPLLQPGESRHIVLAYTEPGGMDGWQPNQLTSIEWFPFREGQRSVEIAIDQQTAYRPSSF